MKKSSITWYFLVILLAALLSGCGTKDDNSTTSSYVGVPNPNIFTPTGTVSGLLRDAVTNVAIANAQIYIMDRQATTNSAGLFTIYNVPALCGTGVEEGVCNEPYSVVIDMKNVNAALPLGAARYPAMAYADAMVTYTSLGETSGSSSTTNHNTPVNGFVANITPFVGKLDANLKIQVVAKNLAPVPGATVYLYYENRHGTALQPSTGTGTTDDESLDTEDGGFPGMLIATATSDATGFVTFSNIEAKRDYVVKATFSALGYQGWWIDCDPLSIVIGSCTEEDFDCILAPSDGMTDIYALNQGGSTTVSPTGACFNRPLIIDTADNTAPFVISTSPADLSDIAVPESGTLDVAFTFSEPMDTTGYAANLTRDTSVNGGLWNDVDVIYQGPKQGNIPYTLAWNTTGTVLTVSIPYDALYPASRYFVFLDDTDLQDLVGNDYVELGKGHVSFTTSGGFNVDAPVIAWTQTSSVSFEWAPVSNAIGYYVYYEIVGCSDMDVVEDCDMEGCEPHLFTTPTFNLTTIADDLYTCIALGFSVNFKVTAVNCNLSESDFSNPLTFTDTAPAAPTGLARRAGTTVAPNNYNLDWDGSAPYYNIYVEEVVNGIGFGYEKANDDPLTLPTGSVESYIWTDPGDGFADGQLKITYNVKVTAVSMFGTESLPSASVVVEDLARPEAWAPAIAGWSQKVGVYTATGTLAVHFNGPMLYSDIILASNWDFAYPTGTSAAGVTEGFGGALGAITWDEATNIAYVPWAINVAATYSIGYGAINPTFDGVSISSGLALATAITATTGL
jgi:hypothetical protein